MRFFNWRAVRIGLDTVYGIELQDESAERMKEELILIITKVVEPRFLQIVRTGGHMMSRCRFECLPILHHVRLSRSLPVHVNEGVLQDPEKPCPGVCPLVVRVPKPVCLQVCLLNEIVGI
jgi:hypothetical protein